MIYSRTGRLFSSASISELFDERRRSIINEIRSKSENELLNISIEQYSEYLSSLHKLDFPQIDDVKYEISSYESDIPASRFPAEFGILDRDGTIRKDIIVFHLPYQGDISYLNYRPSGHYFSSAPGVIIEGTEFLFEYINFYNDSEKIKKEFNNDLQSFKTSYYALKADFDAYNNGLTDFVFREINNRRQTLLAKINFLSTFNVPLKSSHNTPKHFLSLHQNFEKK